MPVFPSFCNIRSDNIMSLALTVPWLMTLTSQDTSTQVVDKVYTIAGVQGFWEVSGYNLVDPLFAGTMSMDLAFSIRGVEVCKRRLVLMMGKIWSDGEVGAFLDILKRFQAIYLTDPTTLHLQYSIHTLSTYKVAPLMLFVPLYGLTRWHIKEKTSSLCYNCYFSETIHSLYAIHVTPMGAGKKFVVAIEVKFETTTGDVLLEREFLFDHRNYLDVLHYRKFIEWCEYLSTQFYEIDEKENQRIMKEGLEDQEFHDLVTEFMDDNLDLLTER